MTQKNQEKSANFSRRALLKAGGALVVSIGAPVTFDFAQADDAHTRQHERRGETAADAGSAFKLCRGQCRRHDRGLFRQDGYGPRHRGRHRADGGRRARRAVFERQDVHGRHGDQREPGRRLRLDRRARGRQADAARRRRSAARAGRNGGRQAWPAGRSADGDRRRRSRQGRSGKEGVLPRTRRRPLFQRAARLERQDRQSAAGARQGRAEGSRRTIESSASRSNATTSRRASSRSRTSTPTSKCRAWCMAA